MSQSPLVNYRDYSARHWNGRAGNGVKRIVIHHTAGVISVEQLGSVFHNKEASSTYGIGYDARVGQYVPEEYRPWTTSGWEPDRNCVTIEVSNSAAGGNWPVSDAVMNKLVDLCADICRRNGISRLYYDGKNGTLLRHCDYASTACPGPYIKAKTQWICDQVNAKLGSHAAAKPASSNPSTPKTSGSIDQMARDVIAGKYGNGDQRKAALGSNYAAVQARVNEILSGKASAPAAKPAAPAFNVEQAARDVIAGKYGTGDARKKALGSHYNEVQTRVNQILAGGKTTSAAPSVNIDAEARKVIRGDYGNGATRKQRLTAKFGAATAEKIQARVNQLL